MGSISDKFINQYVIVRTYSAGVFAGTLVQKEGAEVELSNARRIWYWKGAATLSQLAGAGTSDPDNCQFPQEVEQVLLIGVIEIIKVSKEAMEAIKKVPIWHVDSRPVGGAGEEDSAREEDGSGRG